MAPEETIRALKSTFAELASRIHAQNHDKHEISTFAELICLGYYHQKRFLFISTERAFGMFGWLE